VEHYHALLVAYYCQHQARQCLALRPLSHTIDISSGSIFEVDCDAERLLSSLRLQVCCTADLQKMAIRSNWLNAETSCGLWSRFGQVYGRHLMLVIPMQLSVSQKDYISRGAAQFCVRSSVTCMLDHGWQVTQ
jgi:hypothetical protein